MPSAKVACYIFLLTLFGFGKELSEEFTMTAEKDLKTFQQTIKAGDFCCIDALRVNWQMTF